jgi:predicted RNA-binding protein YlxR (DUF448 family)
MHAFVPQSTPQVSSRVRTRTCVGCHARGEARVDLFRVFVVGGEVQVDLHDRSSGRGAWLHFRTRCIQSACAGQLQRTLGCDASAASLVTKLIRSAVQVLDVVPSVSVIDRSMEVV